jgi:hypothetical protein
MVDSEHTYAFGTRYWLAAHAFPRFRVMFIDNNGGAKSHAPCVVGVSRPLRSLGRRWRASGMRSERRSEHQSALRLAAGQCLQWPGVRTGFPLTGVACRLGSSIIKTASPKKGQCLLVQSSDPTADGHWHQLWCCRTVNCTEYKLRSADMGMDYGGCVLHIRVICVTIRQSYNRGCMIA